MGQPPPQIVVAGHQIPTRVCVGVDAANQATRDSSAPHYFVPAFLAHSVSIIFSCASRSSRIAGSKVLRTPDHPDSMLRTRILARAGTNDAAPTETASGWRAKTVAIASDTVSSAEFSRDMARTPSVSEATAHRPPRQEFRRPCEHKAGLFPHLTPFSTPHFSPMGLSHHNRNGPQWSGGAESSTR